MLYAKGMTTFVSLALVFVGSWLLAPSSAVAQAARPWRAAVPESLPPQYQLDPKGRTTGFAIDVMNELASRLGQPIEYVIKPNWQATMTALISGEVDLIPSAGITETRKVELAFSRPLETFQLGVFVRADNRSIVTLADLTGKRIGTVGPANSKTSLLKEFKQYDYQHFEHPSQSLVSLLAGEVDAIIYPEQAMLVHAHRADLDHRIRHLDEPLGEFRRGVAVRADRAALLDLINPAIAALQNDPIYTKIYAKWYGRPDNWWTADRVLMAAGAFVGVALVMFLLIRFVLLQKLNARLTQQIAERRLAESQRQRLQDVMQQNQKMEAVGRLAGGIAHDFNNVLQGIFTSVELAQRQALAPDVKRLLGQARDFGDRGRDLVRQIMTFSRRDNATLGPLDLSTVCLEALKLVRALLPSSIDIETELPEAPAPMIGNATQLQQVLINLCTNAAHAMTDHQGTITIKLLADGERWSLSVKDTGRGIPQDVLPHIFEPFYTTKAVGDGTGMGLTVVHGIVTGHGGHISVASDADVGTTFTLTFPMSSAAVPISTDAPTAQTATTGRGRIMVVDDERLIVELCREMLTAQGYEVESFQEGQAALNRVIRRDAPPIDLIVTDNAMPGMSGIQLAKAVGSLSDGPPVVLISGFLDEAEVTRSKDVVAGCVYKPLKIDEFTAVVAAHVRGPARAAT